MVTYPTIKATILGHGWDVDGDATATDKGWDCVDVVKKAATMYFPGVPLSTLGIHGNGNQIFANANPKYFQKIENDEKNANQLPKPGDIMCFDSTPWPGYTSTYKNPYGHTGICDSATTAGYTLLMQESYTNKVAFTQYRNWKYRHCQGWLRPIAQPAPAPTTVPKSQLDAANATIADLKKQLTAAQAKVTELGKVVANQQNQLASLQAQLATASNDTTQLNALGKALRWFVARVGLK